MAESVRLAGTGRLSGGETVTWTIADGTRGRRWRETMSVDGRSSRSILVEVGRDGSIGRLEIAGPAGLLTVHPAADATTLHGNVVTTRGIRHVTLEWSGTHRLIADRSPALASLAIGDGLPGLPGRGAVRRLPAVWIGDDLAPVQTDLLVTRIDDESWDLEVDDPASRRRRLLGPGAFSVDRRGLPTLIASAEWPLER